MLTLMQKTRSRIMLASLLAVDFVFTVTVWLIALFLAYALFNGLETLEWGRSALNWLRFDSPPMDTYWMAVRHGVLFTTQDRFQFSALGVFLYTTFFTSIWLWVYVLSSSLTRIMRLSQSILNGSFRFFDVEEKPLRTLGVLSIVLTTIVFAIIPVIQ